MNNVIFLFIGTIFSFRFILEQRVGGFLPAQFYGHNNVAVAPFLGERPPKGSVFKLL